MEGIGESMSEDICTICSHHPQNPKTLELCKHSFCTECIEESFQKWKPKCPICGVLYGEIKGTQPDGDMDVSYSNSILQGYESSGTIVIRYYFPDGIQKEHHPNPGVPYSGTGRTAYLPNNEEGQKVLQLLRRAFNARVVFTVGRSATTGVDNTVIWNDIHHKTSLHGGQFNFGYPDPTYLNRVQQELAAHGIK